MSRVPLLTAAQLLYEVKETSLKNDALFRGTFESSDNWFHREIKWNKLWMTIDLFVLLSVLSLFWIQICLSLFSFFLFFFYVDNARIYNWNEHRSYIRKMTLSSRRKIFLLWKNKEFFRGVFCSLSATGQMLCRSSLTSSIPADKRQLN